MAPTAPSTKRQSFFLCNFFKSYFLL